MRVTLTVNGVRVLSREVDDIDWGKTVVAMLTDDMRQAGWATFLDAGSLVMLDRMDGHKRQSGRVSLDFD